MDDIQEGLHQNDIRNNVVRVWEYKGHPCLIMENNMGYLCGYVMFDLDSPISGKGYDEITSDYGLSVHGGLTFAQTVNVLHFGSLPLAELAGGRLSMYMIGFDCGHSGDAPYSKNKNPFAHDVEDAFSCMFGSVMIPISKHVWTPDEVADEIESIIEQLADAAAI